MYLYDDDKDTFFYGTQHNAKRIPNINSEIVDRISKFLGIPYVYENKPGKKSFAPLDLLDYIYAVLHSPKYREKYADLLKKDFPRIPYSKNVSLFWKLVDFGKKLRYLHLFTDLGTGTVSSLKSIKYPISGDNRVERISFDNGRVFINRSQYFDGVSAATWNFHLGGYQVASKWLKDRKGRALTFDEIDHYCKIIAVLVETHKLMKKIDLIVEW